MVCHVLLNGIYGVLVGMARDEGYLSSTEHFHKLDGVLHFLYPAAERNVLGHINVGP